MKIFVINLDRNSERLQYMSEQFEKFGLTWERIVGVDGKNLTSDQLEKVQQNGALDSFGDPLSLGHIGCSLSHIKVYEKMIAEKIDRCVIFEDDAVVTNELVSVLKQDWTSKNYWEYVHLGYPPMNFVWLGQWFRASFRTILRKPLFIFYFILKIPYIILLYFFETCRHNLFRFFRITKPARFFRPLYHNNCYMLSLAGAEKIMKIAYPVRYVADQLTNRARIEVGLKFYGCVPPPIKKNKGNFVSDTTKVKIS